MSEQSPERPDTPSPSESPRARCNIEIKARVASLERIRPIAERLATEHLGRQLQTDTYFHCRRGRLKLREIDGRDAQLISYARPDAANAKASHYYLTPVPDPAALKQSLAEALGIRSVVVKDRDIYLHHNVRIHLDQVQGFGCFLELEAVLVEGMDERDGRAQVERLQQQLGIDAEDLLPGSYGEMS